MEEGLTNVGGGEEEDVQHIGATACEFIMNDNDDDDDVTCY